MKKEILSTSDELFENCDERIVIFRDEQPDWCRNWCDHPFVLWSNCRNYCGDRNAESPFEEVLDEDGCETGEQKLRDGVVAFPVSVYDHSGIAYSLGSGRGFPDYCWDVTPNVLWLWTDKEHWERMCGKDSWEKVKDDEDELREQAKLEVDELNLDECGMWFGWHHEKKVRWTKNYEDGNVVQGCDWDVVDSCGGYLTDKVDDIDFPRKGIPVFAEDETCFVGEEHDA